jgi:hypothetical protein
VGKHQIASQTPNAETQAAMREAQAMALPKTPRFSTTEEMFAELDSAVNASIAPHIPKSNKK